MLASYVGFAVRNVMIRKASARRSVMVDGTAMLGLVNPACTHCRFQRLPKNVLSRARLAQPFSQSFVCRAKIIISGLLRTARGVEELVGIYQRIGACFHCAAA